MTLINCTAAAAVSIEVIQNNKLPMSDKQVINELNFRVASLRQNLTDCQKELEQYRGVEAQADSKIKALNKMHSDKVKGLLNSIQVLKKEKAQVESLSKEHKRSKLIEQMNKEILDQDLVIEVLRKIIYDDKGKEGGRKVCDDQVVKALTKGPQRIRPLTREELRMEIEKLKSHNVTLETKIKAGGGKVGRKEDDELSSISSVAQKSMVNEGEEVLRRVRELQGENQGLKLELATKGRIIQKLRNQSREKEKLRAELELMVNQAELASQKVVTYERLLRESKENMNQKIMELYERELKVEELQLNTRANTDQLREAHESTNILVQEMKQEKEQLQCEYDLLKKENDNLILENMTLKKRQEEGKNKNNQMRTLYTQKQEELEKKLTRYEQETNRILADKQQLEDDLRSLQSQLFKERAQWVEEKNSLLTELEKAPVNRSVSKSMIREEVSSEEVAKLRKENRDLKEALQSAGGHGNSMLLERLENYRIKLQMYESRGDAKSERKLHDEIFEKYEKLLDDHEALKQQVANIPSKVRRKYVVEITKNEQRKFDDLSSGVSGLNLADVDSDVLEDYDSNYDYELVVNEYAHKEKGVPRVTEEDRQLLKLISSDLWAFVKDPAVGMKMEEIINIDEEQEKQQNQELAKRIRKINNLSSKMGKKVTLYDSQLVDLDNVSENVSATSDLKAQMKEFNSDIEIDVKKLPAEIRNIPKIRGFEEMSDSVSEEANMSSAKSGDSMLGRRKKTEKAGVLKRGKGEPSSSSESELMNSDVSSVGIRESALAGMDSDVSTDFRKKKARRGC